MTSSSQRRAATRAARARQAATGEAYNTARRQSIDTPPEPEGHPFQPGRWRRELCADAGCNLQRDAPVHRIGGLTPPPEWFAWAYGLPMLSTSHDERTRTVAVLDGRGERVLASLTVPWRPADDLLAEYDAAGLLGPMARRREIELGRPDLLAHQLGYKAGAWWQWPDGSWRSPAHALRRRHVATVRPLAPGQRDLQALTVQEYPGGRVVVDELIEAVDADATGAADELLHAALDRHGYTVSRWGWQKLPGRVRYGLALPGHRAERSWWTLATVRFLRDCRVGAPDGPEHTYRAGTTASMNQRGQAGAEVDRGSWWSSTDVDGAYIVDADAVEVVEVLERTEPFWRDAMLSVTQVTEALAGHHAGAAEAAAAWDRAGLVVAYTAAALVVYTAAPEYVAIGQVPRDYWDGNRLTKPYEAIVTGSTGYQHQVRRPALPLDPVAAVAEAREDLRRESARYRETSD